MWINVPSLANALLDAGLSMPAVKREGMGGKKFCAECSREEELSALLLLSCVALMHGARSRQQILEWARRESRWLPWLGIEDERKLKNALESGVLEQVDRWQWEQAVSDWTADVLEYLQLFDESEEGRTREAEAPVVESLSLRLNAFLDRLIGPAENRKQAPEFEELLVGLALTGYIESDVLNRLQAEQEFLKAEPSSIAGVPMAPPSGRRWQQRLAA